VLLPRSRPSAVSNQPHRQQEWPLGAALRAPWTKWELLATQHSTPKDTAKRLLRPFFEPLVRALLELMPNFGPDY